MRCSETMSLPRNLIIHQSTSTMTHSTTYLQYANEDIASIPMESGFLAFGDVPISNALSTETSSSRHYEYHGYNHWEKVKNENVGDHENSKHHQRSGRKTLNLYFDGHHHVGSWNSIFAILEIAECGWNTTSTGWDRRREITKNYAHTVTGMLWSQIWIDCYRKSYEKQMRTVKIVTHIEKNKELKRKIDPTDSGMRKRSFMVSSEQRYHHRWTHKLLCWTKR